MQIAHIDTLIRLLGGGAAFSREFGISQQAVSRMRRGNSISPGLSARVVEMIESDRPDTDLRKWHLHDPWGDLPRMSALETIGLVYGMPPEHEAVRALAEEMGIDIRN